MESLFKVATLASLVLTASTTALGHATCVGETYSGKRVTVSAISVGTMGYLDRVEVRAEDDSGVLTEYVIHRESAPQFFEAVTEDDRAMVGLQSYDDLGFNLVRIEYFGGNYWEHIWASLRADHVEPLSHMHVWMGPGHDRSAQYKFNDVACEVSLDP